MSPHEDSAERPQKRIKLDEAPRATAPITAPENAELTDADKEARAGITEYINPNTSGFTGLLKARYTDFLVNEITPDGQVVHLTNLDVPKFGDEPDYATGTGVEPLPQPTQAENGNANGKEKPAGSADYRGKQSCEDTIPQKDIDELKSVFGELTAQAMLKLNASILKHPNLKTKEFGSFLTGPLPDKDQRTEAHLLVRRTFSGRLETTTQSDNCFRFSASKPQTRNPVVKPREHVGGSWQPGGKLQWEQVGGDYLHFTMFKENKDTMEVIYFLASEMKIDKKHFGFAGTKDRRAATSQRVSVKRCHAAPLARVARKLNRAMIGDFSHHWSGLELGNLAGNEFVITLRECHFPGEEGLSLEERIELAKRSLSASVKEFQSNGFINYFGMQRFGSFATGTDEIGLSMLKEDLEGAVKQILYYSPAALEAAMNPDAPALISSDDKARAKAINYWEQTQNSHKALQMLPRKFGAEQAIIRHLGFKQSYTQELRRLKDWQGALNAVPRGLRMMYPHAYQSLVWNTVAGRRWQRFGPVVIEGDLVLVKEHKDKEPAEVVEEVDADGEVVIVPQGDNSAKAAEDKYERARALTAEEAASGKYTIDDIVLPQPGFDVEYPKNEIGEFYKEFMGSERGGGLDPHNMRRKWKEVSLSGGYRKLLARPAGASFEVKPYQYDDQQLAETDMDRLIKAGKVRSEVGNAEIQAVREPQAEPKLAVVLKFKLGSSTYATMALRELMKEGGTQAFKPEYNTGR
ncbi:pseudouridine synthase-like protein TruD/Pus7 [Saccharata proteae CBS 121410]|uniref:Pseudouridine synthase-like protein TruD/Pus7 n=1 Tax=Saccharata proteae CBS 121410 TaxID=1314787 RepID=A0A9P4HT33_9PEZI|nr:pseudouridine synthase-like protein TruD/Pus7 [Saccharata proteae CBS 121410]